MNTDSDAHSSLEQRQPLLSDNHEHTPPLTTARRIINYFHKLNLTSLLLLLFATLLFILIIGLTPILYCVYIPSRINSALNPPPATVSSSLTLHHCNIQSISGDVHPNITTSLSLSLTIHDPPPLDMFMMSSFLSVTAVDMARPSSDPLYKQHLARLLLPELALPRGIDDVPILYDAQVDQVNIALLEHLLHSYMRSRNTTAWDYTAQALSVFTIPHLGSWTVPLVRQGSLFPLPLSDSFPSNSSLDLTFQDPDIQTIPPAPGSPISSPQYQLTTQIAFNNPFPISISPLDWLVSISVYSHAIHLADITLPDAAISLTYGRNDHITIRVLTDSTTHTVLMDLIGKLSDGQDTLLTFRDLNMQWFINLVAKNRSRSVTVLISTLPVTLVTGYMVYERAVLGKKQRNYEDEFGPEFHKGLRKMYHDFNTPQPVESVHTSLE
ncbi:hypothetical protein BATDEDRAFT_36278 [Batrachochytrium dendrobatidis JAM81]|uniref:Transmembrane protein n=1 Tax=Batrachochytrium dendrobatidis (strain JAM81 / FGSC 10211) TaxID=684364 RepID=F4PEE9_BATDJ|nr:uncharacterized protein BATDEDRAFT_36278 [Batrachochytrium dendrobatidis JAM81]EGF76359.1 hypothetical protein BATDEDRAFT_36278 [Batrachochytrium dendrobatidis JAM81]|eukprot:XP_006682987.1 hypothetical protein BATDEDRAFT_36278 [Batrachochytrium dendrobatidis JAM81]